MRIPAVRNIDSNFDKKDYSERVKACTLCPLRENCKAPVPASLGYLNIMVVGEAPGREEDQAGRGFIGKSGQKLFHELSKVGINRDDILVSNTVKCRPKDNKLPNVSYITKCPWLTEEIKTLKPRFILATGNSSLYYFKRIAKGITEWNGVTEWNNRAEAWVTYCIHPASVLYDPKNYQSLRHAIQSFKDTISRFIEEDR